MNFQKLLNHMFTVIEEMANDRTLNKQEKLNALTDKLANLLEELDNAVSQLPPGISMIAQVLVDNPGMDQIEKEVIVKPIAEMFYQMWKFKQGWLGK